MNVFDAAVPRPVDGTISKRTDRRPAFSSFWLRFALDKASDEKTSASRVRGREAATGQDGPPSRAISVAPPDQVATLPPAGPPERRRFG